jgi:hypothetical protein
MQNPIKLTSSGLTIRVPLQNQEATRLASELMCGCRKASVITNDASTIFPSLMAFDKVDAKRMCEALANATSLAASLCDTYGQRDFLLSILAEASAKLAAA